MNLLRQVLDEIAQLPDDQQEMLIKILQQRRHESRREEIARDAQQSLNDFRLGELRSQSAQEAILELRQFSGEIDV